MAAAAIDAAAADPPSCCACCVSCMLFGAWLVGAWVNCSFDRDSLGQGRVELAYAYGLSDACGFAQLNPTNCRIIRIGTTYLTDIQPPNAIYSQHTHSKNQSMQRQNAGDPLRRRPLVPSGRKRAAAVARALAARRPAAAGAKRLLGLG